MLGRISAFLYGAACYLLFVAVFVYAYAFVGNLGIARSLDSGPESSFAFLALAMNVGLLGLFAIQHSVMARPWFKAAWTKLVPKPVERSTYVLFSNLAMILLFWKWQPMGGVIWSVDNKAGWWVLQGLFALGWLIVLYASFLINHFELFGLQQVWLYLRGKSAAPVAFRTPGLYRHLRHPLYVGWLLMFWAAPKMTIAHLLFALVTTMYILLAIQFEERDLARVHPEYAAYKQHVPMFVPVGSSKQREPGAVRQASARHVS